MWYLCEFISLGCILKMIHHLRFENQLLRNITIDKVDVWQLILKYWMLNLLSQHCHDVFEL